MRGIFHDTQTRAAMKDCHPPGEAVSLPYAAKVAQATTSSISTSKAALKRKNDV
jgi:hypothetical protein